MSRPAAVIPFVKASACGNDFLIIDGIHAPAGLAAFSRRICERHHGVGADGVEWLFPADDADVEARLFNADGSEAEISGNGTRCVAAFICSEQGKEKIVIRTGAGLKTCNFVSRKDNQFEFEVAMGKPEVGNEFAIRLAAREVRGIPVSMGNPHYVIFVKEFAPEWQAQAAEIGRHPEFKHGINVELVNAIDKKISMSGSLSAESARHSPQALVRALRPSPPSWLRSQSPQYECKRQGVCKPSAGSARSFYGAQPNLSAGANSSYDRRTNDGRSSRRRRKERRNYTRNHSKCRK